MKISYEDGHVVVRIPCGEADIKAASVSKSGKSRMIATTSGFAKIDGAPAGVKIGLNLIAGVEK